MSLPGVSRYTRRLVGACMRELEATEMKWEMRTKDERHKIRAIEPRSAQSASNKRSSKVRIGSGVKGVYLYAAYVR